MEVGGTSGMTDEEISFQDGVITSKYRTARVWLERQHYIGAVGQASQSMASIKEFGS